MLKRRRDRRVPGVVRAQARAITPTAQWFIFRIVVTANLTTPETISFLNPNAVHFVVCFPFHYPVIGFQIFPRRRVAGVYS